MMKKSAYRNLLKYSTVCNIIDIYGNWHINMTSTQIYLVLTKLASRLGHDAGRFDNKQSVTTHKHTTSAGTWGTPVNAP